MLRFGRFGTVVLYRGREHPSQVVLFISGDGGWNLGVVGMARAVAAAGALAVGIDIRACVQSCSRVARCWTRTRVLTTSAATTKPSPGGS